MPKLGISLIVISAMLLLYSWKFETRWVEFRRDSFKIAQLPRGLNNIKIAFLSDLHIASYKDLKLLDAQIEHINSEKLDLVLIGGDIAENAFWLKKTARSLSKIQSGGATYVVRGNHDADVGHSFFSILSSNGLIPCGNSQFHLEHSGTPFVLATIDDYRLADSRPAIALDGLNGNEFTIVMAHEPKSIKLISKEGLADKVDLALVGHTHGGQVTFFGLFSPLAQRSFPGWSSQWRSIGGIPTLFSNGLGQQYNIRFCARPQVHIISLDSLSN